MGDIPDDPQNAISFAQKGILSFAGSGPNTRGMQMFITLTDRKTHLGQEPWEVPFAQIVYGVENLKHINTEYGDDVDQQQIWRRGYAYLDAFPGLSFLVDCAMLEQNP